ncbi:MAG TPA: 16S rRNA (cytosine(1402)-N(4))-methyltransferase RsmH [Blastocatellia bacterium]|nr:16S rRNA (cytosine(1402)-N(4))-methyltransferase RsmH [Blastocatellia bacterium]
MSIDPVAADDERRAMSLPANQHPTHQPVLLDEIIHWLRPADGGRFVDCTVGLGGHTEAILGASPRTTVIGIDRDGEGLQIAITRLARFGTRFQTVHGNFKELDRMLENLDVRQVRGILADLGVSSLQLDRAERGFGFQHDAPLDMRMDRDSGETAADLVNHLPEDQLANLIFKYGEERKSRRIARAIVMERSRARIATTKQLADIVVKAARVPGRWRVHPATRTFQAIRIAVNQELDGLGSFVSKAISALEPEGRLAIISFHSLEDRIIKWSFKRESGQCICSEINQRESLWPDTCEMPGDFESETGIPGGDPCGARSRVQILTRKPVKPRPEEVSQNPRSRSARLRVCERVTPILD